MVAERERVDRLNLRISTPEGVPPPSYRNAGGTNEFATKKLLLMFLGKGLSKPADDVGQQAKDNLHAVERQASAGL